MTVRRYWRIVSILPRADAGPMEMAGLALYDGATLRVPTVTANLLPSGGVLAALTDGDANTTATWSSAKGLVIHMDLGSALNVDSLRITAGPSASRFPYAFALQGSDDDTTWVTLEEVVGLTYKGPGQVSRAGVGGDPHRSKTVLHVRAGASAIQETVGKTVTPVGSVAVSTAQSKFDGRSIVFADYPDRIAVPDSTDFTLGLLDFTAEAWTYLTDGSTTRIALCHSAAAGGFYAFQIARYADGGGVVRITDGSSVPSLEVPPGTWPLNQWVHVSLCRWQGNLAFHLNGVGVYMTGRSADIPTLDVAAPLTIGKYADDSDNRFVWVGHMDEVRITKGVARYIHDFVPPTARFSTDQKVSDLDIGTGTARSLGFVASAGANADVPAAFATPVPRAWSLRDYLMSPTGNGRIAGTVKEKNTPVNTPLRRRVLLLRERDGQVVQETWSDAVTGAYEFMRLPVGETYLALTLDYAHNYRAVAADNLIPEVVS